MSGPVEQFVQLANDLLATLAADLSIRGDDVVQVVLRRKNARLMPARGRTSSGLLYQVHGAGCRIQARDRGTMDLDSTPDGSTAFDGWRVRQWAASIGMPEPDDRAVAAEATELVNSGLIRSLKPGWWAWRPGG